jgi:hypothetical protein
MFNKHARDKGTQQLGKTSPKHEIIKNNSVHEHCTVLKVGKNYFNDPFMCFLGKNFPGAMGIGFSGKWIPKKWGTVFSKRGEASS